MSPLPRRPVAMYVAALSAALLLAGCGGGGGEGGQDSASGPSKSAAPQVKQDPKLHAMLPAELQKPGATVIVATDPSYPPDEFFAADNKTITGMDIDLGHALGQKLGVEFQFQKAGFDAIIPGLASGTYDLGISSFTDTKKREQTVDFVTYFTAGTSLVVQAGNPKHLAPEGNALCGKKVAVEKGTIQESPDIPDRSSKCVSAGKPKVEALVFPDQNGANLALSTGRADAVLVDSPVAVYMKRQSKGQFEIVGKPYTTAPYGIAVPKDSPELRDAIQAALESLMSDGTYDEILAKWDMQDGAITDPQINAAKS